MLLRVLLGLLALPFAAVGLLATGFGGPTFAVVYLAAVTPWLVASDIRRHRLPNVLVLPGVGIGLLACAGEWLASGRPPLVPLIAGAAYCGFLLLLNLVGGMGMGDVKLAAALGLASWNLSVAVLSPVVAFLVGGIVSVVLLIAGQRGRRIAFGPFLLGGFWTAVALVAVSRLPSVL
jgi:leader peptidase (prepilin peptidase)/N-methyltransferase